MQLMKMLTHSVLDSFKNYQSNLVENLIKMLPKPSNKYSVSITIKYDEHMLVVGYFNLNLFPKTQFKLF